MGNSPLTGLYQAKNQLPGGTITYLGRGKRVHHILLAALDKLRPIGEQLQGSIPREWFPYIILHDAYVSGVQNRDIMGKLYISEGTFNRTRRSAIRSMAGVLAEMEPFA